MKVVAGSNGDHCVFCGIVAGTSAASVVYENEHVLAFMDITPVTPGHVLVVPKAHVVGLSEASDVDGARVWSVARRIAGSLRDSELRCDGVNLFLADGVAAGQEVFHLHLHVLPRYSGDGFRIQREFTHPDRDNLDLAASAIRARLPHNRR